MSDSFHSAGSDSQRLSRQKLFQDALLELAHARVNADDLFVSLHVITEVGARTLEVERASVWIFDDDRTKIVCRDLYLREENAHSCDHVLYARDFPAYFRSLEANRTLAVVNCNADDRTSELTESYHRPNGIVSMLDAPIRQAGVIVGIVCHEHVGSEREWTAEEQSFAGSIADMCALTLERSERQHAEEEIRRRDALLDGVAKAASQMFSDTEREIGSRDVKLEALARLGCLLLSAQTGAEDFETLLGLVGTGLEASRVSLFAEHQDVYTGDLVTSERGRWAPDSSGSTLEIDVRWDERGLKRWRGEFVQGKSIASTVRALPQGERPAFEMRFARSVLAVPIVRPEGLQGYLEIADQHLEREWTDAERSFAAAAAAMLGISTVL